MKKFKNKGGFCDIFSSPRVQAVKSARIWLTTNININGSDKLLLIWLTITLLISQPFYSRQRDVFQFSLHILKEKWLNFLICDKNRFA